MTLPEALVACTAIIMGGLVFIYFFKYMCGPQSVSSVEQPTYRYEWKGPAGSNPEWMSDLEPKAPSPNSKDDEDA